MEVCPVECIVPGIPVGEWPWYYIDPDVCIDCGACIPECPYEAIFEEEEVPTEFTAKGGEFIARVGLEDHYEGKNDKGEAVVLDCVQRLQVGEQVDLSPDIKPNYDYFSDGPGYGALDSEEASTIDTAVPIVGTDTAMETATAALEPEDIKDEETAQSSLETTSSTPEDVASGDEGPPPERPVEQSGITPPLFFKLGLIRGLIGHILGTVMGMGLVVSIRAMMDLDPWAAEPAWVIGALTGTIGFMIGVGALTDWFKWVLGQETPMRHGPPKDTPDWTRYLGVDYSHKVIGVQYTVTSVLIMLIGGSLAWIFRLELLQPDMQYISMGTYNSIMSAHGIIMIASILVGVGGMTNYLVPLLIGASDMAFPRLNAFGYWINVPGALLLVTALFVGGWDTGWVGYPPLSARAPIGVQLFFLGVYMIGLSSIVGSLNILVTVARMRAKGMTLFRMPIFVWASLATSIIQLTATQFIGLAFLMVLVQRVLGMGFFDPILSEAAQAIGAPPGDPILFQHMFWFYSHPAVYVFILPGLGIISELLPVFSRKPLFGYKWIALSSLSIALLGFLVWAHHMFTSGMEEFLRVPFMMATLLVAVPTGIKFFSWLATLWQGKLVFPTPMLFALGAISVFLIGGLTGPPTGTVATDLFLHDTYWVVGHFHATMFGGFVFPFFAAIYYWYPKVTGRKYNEALGKLHFWLMTPAFWVQSIGQSAAGLLGMRRRIADYDPALGVETHHLFITLAGFAIGISILICIFNLVRSRKVGEVAASNPWGSRSPEFLVPSPIPEHSFAHPIVVEGEPYDYGLPGSVYVTMLPETKTE